MNKIDVIVQNVINKTANEQKANQLVRSNINKLMLSERRSFSKEVYEISERLFQLIEYAIENGEGQYRDKITLGYVDDNGEKQIEEAFYINYYVSVENEMKSICPIIRNILVMTVQFSSYEAYLANDDKFIFNGSSDPRAEGLSISFPIFNGEINKNNVMLILAHEVEHLYQYQMSVNSKNPIKPQKLYILANHAMASSDELLKNIGYIIYFFSNVEIDARMQEFYRELERNREYDYLDLYNNTKVWGLFQTVKEMFDEIVKMDKQEVGKRTMELGLHRHEFIKLVRIQINKFLWKIERIWQQFNIDKLNEEQIRPKGIFFFK